MIYTDLTRKAMIIAYNAHHGQLDKSGVPYIFHPFHLAEQMTDEITVCSALLHDVAEDTSVTIEELEKDFPAEVTDALKLLTHDKNTDYLDYIRKISTNPVAKAVKAADLKHNSDISRIGCEVVRCSEKTAERLEKYAAALKLLTDTD
ncbi:HD domain-containing protein [Ruminococcus flavefaciens]|uniref:HD domain-containing protein n=1 Tax=Ruminococcus flavefaciens TaxID=1265 RepID=UPI0002D82DAB|nr:HD domain-containing protein [Ruminococcus flavefaciens]